MLLVDSHRNAHLTPVCARYLITYLKALYIYLSRRPHRKQTTRNLGIKKLEVEAVDVKLPGPIH